MIEVIRDSGFLHLLSKESYVMAEKSQNLHELICEMSLVRLLLPTTQECDCENQVRKCLLNRAVHTLKVPIFIIQILLDAPCAGKS